jgi:DNA-directed RNA polymerase subunit RPC12/RpoP
MYIPYMSENEDLEEKKLLGSGGYALARITEDEEIKANLGIPQIFLANVGRLSEDRFLKYYCNACGKDFDGSPIIKYETPNEELGQGVVLVEKGEYKCKSCDNIIALYRKFNK